MTTWPRCSLWVPALTLTVSGLPTALGDTPPSPLTIVRDVGGASALPYYEALHLHVLAGVPTDTTTSSASVVAAPAGRERGYRESDVLPVRSTELTPGPVSPRALHAPGLTPIFLIGTDSTSESWLLEHRERLRALKAIGFVVNVDSQEKLEELRRQAPGLTLSPASGDDLARRLHLDHYPVLITATGIEP